MPALQSVLAKDCLRQSGRKEHYPELDIFELRAKFLDKVPQTLVEDTVEDEADQEKTLEKEASDQKIVEAPTAKVSIPKPPPT